MPDLELTELRQIAAKAQRFLILSGRDDSMAKPAGAAASHSLILWQLGTLLHIFLTSHRLQQAPSVRSQVRRLST